MADFWYCFKQKCEKLKLNCLNDLKHISYDKSKNQYLCYCQNKRLDFDLFVENYCSHPLPSSVDTVLLDEKAKKLYLVEFKNQKCSDVDNKEIRKKVEDTINILKQLAKVCSVNFKNYDIFVAIVYNDKPKWRNGICSNTIQFGLEYFKEQNIIKDVKTNDIEWFKKKYLQIKDKVN